MPASVVEDGSGEKGCRRSARQLAAPGLGQREARGDADDRRHHRDDGARLCQRRRGARGAELIGEGRGQPRGRGADQAAADVGGEALAGAAQVQAGRPAAGSCPRS